jgi:hypothetical protein
MEPWLRYILAVVGIAPLKCSTNSDIATIPKELDKTKAKKAILFTVYKKVIK